MNKIAIIVNLSVYIGIGGKRILLRKIRYDNC
jgi:hypothetical protein